MMMRPQSKHMLVSSFAALVLGPVFALAAGPPASITLGVLHPGSRPGGWPVGDMMWPGLQIAADMVNEDPSVMPNTTLLLDAADTECDLGSGLLGMMKLIQQNYIGVVGTGCSVVAKGIAPGFAKKKIPMVTYANSHPDLSVKSNFPWFFRATASDGGVADGLITFMSAMGWKSAATITDLTWFGVSNRFVAKARSLKVPISIVTQMLVLEASKTTSAMKDLKASKAKIIFAVAYNDVTTGMLKTAYDPSIAMMNKNYAWMTASWTLDNIKDAKAKAATAGWIAGFPLLGTKCIGTKALTCTETGKYSKFLTKFKAKFTRSEARYIGAGTYLPGTVDAVDVFAHAIQTVFDNKTYPGEAGFQDQLLVALKTIGSKNLPAVQTPKLSFDQNHDFNFPFEMANVLKDESRVTVGVSNTDGTFTWKAGKKDTMVWPAFDLASKTTSVTPTDSWPKPVSSEADNTMVIAIAASVCGVLVLAMLIIFGRRAWQTRQAKILRAKMVASRKAAMGSQGEAVDVPIPTGKIILVDTDVESSTALWDWNPSFMSQSLILHDEVLRSELKTHNGTELFTEGDAFLVYFTSASDACQWCLAVQERLMVAEWPPQLLKSGIESSERIVIGGQTVFQGLRVRMGAHIGEAGCSKSSELATTPLMQKTREVSDFAHGGQILVSNEIYAEFQSTQTATDNVDVAPVGSISRVDEEDGRADTTCCVQLLPRSLDKRLAEFIPMYEGAEDQLRAPGGIITCAFTSCLDAKIVARINADLAEGVLSKVDQIIRDAAGATDGYECKGGRGKFMHTFATAGAAMDYATKVNDLLLGEAACWDAEIAPNSNSEKFGKRNQDVFKGICVGIGMTTGMPTLFNFNKTTNRMDYFGPMMNMAARINAETCPGEICCCASTRKALSNKVRPSGVNSRGYFALKGISEQTEIIGLLPEHLEARQQDYPNIRETISADSLISAYSPSALSPGSDSGSN